MCRKQVVIDADFTRLLCEYKADSFFERFMEALEVEPVMAWYVADAELLDCEKAQGLITEKKIKVIYPKDFLDDFSMQIFEYNVRYIAEKVNDSPILQQADIFSKSFHLAGKNIGEIISELMAKELNLDLFASNDWGSKRYADTYINSSIYTLHVKNVYELIMVIIDNGKAQEFKWKEIKHLLSEERWKKERGILREKWFQEN